LKEKNTATPSGQGGKKTKTKRKFNYTQFIKKNVLPKFLICLLVACIFIILFTATTVNAVKELGCDEMYCGSEEITIIENFINRAQALLITGVASMVPYFYIPAICLIANAFNEVITIANVINAYGYFIGILRYIIPLLLNIFSISLVTAVSLYMAQIVTNKFKLSRTDSMNYTNFRLKLYDMLKKQDKYNALYKKQQEKIKKLQLNIEKIQWKGVLITAGITVAVQFVSVVLQKILA